MIDDTFSERLRSLLKEELEMWSNGEHLTYDGCIERGKKYNLDLADKAEMEQYIGELVILSQTKVVRIQ